MLLPIQLHRRRVYDHGVPTQDDWDVIFTEPHYDGYPAVRVRLRPIDMGLVAEVIRGAWESRAEPVRPRTRR
jgi:hypothetical protein